MKRKKFRCHDWLCGNSKIAFTQKKKKWWNIVSMQPETIKFSLPIKIFPDKKIFYRLFSLCFRFTPILLSLSEPIRIIWNACVSEILHSRWYKMTEDSSLLTRSRTLILNEYQRKIPRTKCDKEKSRERIM